jgi:hypothetical protein
MSDYVACEEAMCDDRSNNGLELTAYSLRCAPAFGSSSGRALI